MGMGMTLFMEAFVTIHMSVFVLLPLSKLISKDNSRKIFWTLFGVRIAILLFLISSLPQESQSWISWRCLWEHLL